MRSVEELIGWTPDDEDAPAMYVTPAGYVRTRAHVDDLAGWLDGQGRRWGLHHDYDGRAWWVNPIHNLDVERFPTIREALVAAVRKVTGDE